ncbi:MAG: hypothetical protein J0I19_06160 [Alphaproteobacteria bacterium]|nr:hypothetical protein [Alphaproteobacteria bacterium]
MLPTDIGRHIRKMRDRHTGESFWNFKASHVAEVMIALALLGVTVGQLWVSSNQASIMETQNKIVARQLDATRAVERASVSVTDLKITPEAIGRDQNASFAIMATAKNSGHTATRDMTSRYMMSRYMRNQVSAPFYGMDSGLDPATYNLIPVKSRLGANEAIPIGTNGKANGTINGDLNLVNGEVEWMADNIQQVFYAGVIHYRDVFEGTPEHLTKFCFVIGARRPVKGAPAVPYNAGSCPHWNCADEECKSDEIDFYEELKSAYERSKVPVPSALLQKIQQLSRSRTVNPAK